MTSSSNYTTEHHSFLCSIFAVQGYLKVACQRSETASRAEALRPLHSRLLFLYGLGRASLAPNHTGTYQWLRRRRKATDFWIALEEAGGGLTELITSCYN